METLPAGGGVPEIEAEESRMPSPDDSRLGSPSSLYRALPDRRNPLGWAELLGSGRKVGFETSAASTAKVRRRGIRTSTISRKREEGILMVFIAGNLGDAVRVHSVKLDVYLMTWVTSGFLNPFSGYSVERLMRALEL